MRQRFLVNPRGRRRQLRRNRMVRPTKAMYGTPTWRREWGETGLREAQRIYDRAFSKSLPAELRPVGRTEKLTAPYDRDTARREYLAAIRAPLKEARGLREWELLHKYGQNPKRRRGKKAAHNPAPLEARNMARRRSRSRRRKGTARRPRRRAVARAFVSNPRKHRRRSSARRTTHRGRRRSFRRNPPRGGFVGRLMGALMDGLTVTGGVVAQNAINRYVPNFIPATVPQAGILNAVAKDVVGILIGSWGAYQLFGADRARFVVAGQAHAAIARGVRAANIPQVSTLMGEYDPIRLGTYTRGIARELPPAAPANGQVRTLKNVGVYTDGVSFSPSLY